MGSHFLQKWGWWWWWWWWQQQKTVNTFISHLGVRYWCKLSILHPWVNLILWSRYCYRSQWRDKESKEFAQGYTANDRAMGFKPRWSGPKALVVNCPPKAKLLSMTNWKDFHDVALAQPDAELPTLLPRIHVLCFPVWTWPSFWLECSLLIVCLMHI